MNLESITDANGNNLNLVQVDRDADEEISAIGLTMQDESVLLRTMLSPSVNPAETDASEPGLDGWVHGENFFTDGRPQISQEYLAFDQVPSLDKTQLKPAISTATTETTFTTAWEAQDFSRYEVLRDGILIEHTDENFMTDTGLEPDSEYLYTIRTLSGKDQGAEITLQAKTLPADSAATLAETISPLAALAVEPTAQWFMYNTFITDRRVEWDLLKGIGGECAGTFGDSYGGDNRGYVTPALYQDNWSTTSHRTGARVKIDFGPQAILEQKSVGPTRLYNSSGSLKEQRTASTQGIVFSERSVSTNLYQVKISHEVGNPFCNKGAIRYSVYVNIWKSGVMQVNGSRQPVPAHEAYGLFMNSDGSQNWVTMFRGAQGDFFCISGTCPSQSIGKTHSAY